MPEREHNRITDYQKNKFENLNEIVLEDTGTPDILSLIK
jgi:hypothetical protein